MSSGESTQSSLTKRSQTRLSELGDDSRPDDCQCVDWHSDLDLPCWPCYRDGFEDPAPDAEPLEGN